MSSIVVLELKVRIVFMVLFLHSSGGIVSGLRFFHLSLENYLQNIGSDIVELNSWQFLLHLSFIYSLCPQFTIFFPILNIEAIDGSYLFEAVNLRNLLLLLYLLGSIF